MVEIKQEHLNNYDGSNISIDESALVSRAADGDAGSVELLIIRYQQRLYNAILRMCGNTDDSAELTQEAFVRVLQNLKNFRAESSFYTWLFRIGINLTLNFCRKSSRIRFQSLETQTNEELNGRLKDFLIDKTTPAPPAAAQRNELTALLTNAIGKLSQDQRAVIVLRDIEQMSYEQIAEILQIELGTVKSRISRGRKNLREFIEGAIQ